jgi:hypothetical protein
MDHNTLATTVARVFEIEVFQGWKIRPKAQKHAKPPYRHLVLPCEREETVVTLIETSHHKDEFVSHRNVLNFVEGKVGKYPTYGWLNSFFVWNMSRVCTAVVSPEEQT